MCFSAEASFISAGILGATGAYTLRRTLRSEHRNFLLFAIIPLLFAFQQLSEGFVWIFLQRGDPLGLQISSYIFLFFALLVWPSWIPLSLAIFDRSRAAIFFTLFAIGITYGLLAYIPMIWDPSLVETRICHHSICYSQMHPFRSYLALSLYVVLTVGSTLVSSWNLIKYLGILIAASAIITSIFYTYAFVSVWCFFSALISLGVAFLSTRLDRELA